MSPRMARLLMFLLPLGVAADVAVASLRVRYDYAVLSPGDPVHSVFHGRGVAERAVEKTVTIRRPDGTLCVAPREQVTER